MKKIALILGVTILTLSAVKAGSNPTNDVKVDKIEKPFTYRTPNSDTLFILDTPLGRLTKSIWDMDSVSTEKPEIIFVQNLPKR